MDYIQAIKETQQALLNTIDLSFKRSLFAEIDFGQRLIGIIGPRGVGKTTLILQYLKENFAHRNDALYVLADNIIFKAGDLFALTRDLYFKNGIRLLCVDEIHRYDNWNQELKNIYDAFPRLKIIFSGSSSLSLIKGKYDLSRRAVIYEMGGFSFREYLLFEQKMCVPKLTLTGLLEDYPAISGQIAKNESILQYFETYLSGGYYPFFKETDNLPLYFQQINNTIDKTIYEDIASFYHLKTQNLIAFKQILAFLATIPPGDINVNKLANSLKKNHATVSEYLHILHETRLIRFLSRDKIGHGLIRHAKKVFLDNTNLVYALNHNLGIPANKGVLRELFVLNQLQNAGYTPTYTPTGDLRVGDHTFEVGGRTKTYRQIRETTASYLLLDDILIADRQKIPLYLFGFFY